MAEVINSQAGGEVQIDEITLIANTPTNTYEVDLRAVFAELNLFEDLFSNAIYGNILIGDSNNLLTQYAIQGLEGLRINIRTPGLSDKQTLNKTFGIYSISDQQALNNDRYQSYRLHFCSLEMLVDALSKPLNRPFESKAEAMVPMIFNSFVVKTGAYQIPRNLRLTDSGTKKDGVSELKLGAPTYTNTSAGLTSTSKIKFLATNWSPFKCINYIANRTVPSNKALGGTCIFYENNKSYVFTSIDDLIKTGKQDTAQIFKYQYDPANLADDNATGYTLDVAKDCARVLKISYEHNFNVLDNMNMGFFGGQIRAVDPLLKRYREQNYSFEKAYPDFEHTAKKPIDMFPQSPSFLLGKKNTIIDPRRNIVTRYRIPYFHFDKEQTPLVSHVAWLQQRAARMASMSNYSISIYVSGRTDIKVGDMTTFRFPSYAGDAQDPSTFQDPYLSEYFLISAVRHFISPIKHYMTLELVKDSLDQPPDVIVATAPNVSPTWDSVG